MVTNKHILIYLFICLFIVQFKGSVKKPIIFGLYLTAVHVNKNCLDVNMTVYANM